MPVLPHARTQSVRTELRPNPPRNWSKPSSEKKKKKKKLGAASPSEATLMDDEGRPTGESSRQRKVEGARLYTRNIRSTLHQAVETEGLHSTPGTRARRGHKSPLKIP